MGEISEEERENLLYEQSGLQGNINQYENEVQNATEKLKEARAFLSDSRYDLRLFESRHPNLV